MTGRVLKLKQGRPAALEHGPLPTSCLGKLSALALPAGVWVMLPGAETAVLARIGMSCTAQQLRNAIELQQPAVLTFEDGDADRPILIGIVAPVLDDPEEPPQAQTGFTVESDADGRRVRLQAHEEVVLQCGDASISLKRNGRVVIRGAYVETSAVTTNRIKGGSVRIN